MNPLILTQFGLADPNASPVTVNDLITLLNQLVNSTMLGSYIPYVIQNETPGVDDRDKAWIELSTGGIPISIKIFYQGNWRRIYNGMIGEIRGFSGDPSITTDWTPIGHGVIGGAYDGWQICNGKHGSPNLTDKFVVGGHMDNSGGHVGYDGGWQTFVDGKTDLKDGGDPSHKITQVDLPGFDVILSGHEYKDVDQTPNFTPLLDVHYANLITHQLNLGHYGAGTTETPGPEQTEVPTLPPFYVMAFMIFQGY